jgi:hypothetical protein
MTCQDLQCMNYAAYCLHVPRGEKHQFRAVWGNGDDILQLVRRFARAMPPGCWTSLTILWGKTGVGGAIRCGSETIFWHRTRDPLLIRATETENG